MVEYGCGDLSYLLRRLAGAEDHLRRALSEAAVMIDLREAQVLERLHPQLQKGVLYGYESEISIRNLQKEIP